MEATICCVCLDPIDGLEAVTLPCAHIFHGQCLCDHLLRDRRCPLCRAEPFCEDRDDVSIDVTNESEPSEPSGPTYEQALARARASSRRGCKPVRRMLGTLKTWEDRRRAAIVQHRVVLRELNARQKEMQKRAQRDANAKFRARCRKSLALQATLRRRIQRAARAGRACGLRIAARYGFEGSS